jgi:hypothetical protein
MHAAKQIAINIVCHNANGGSTGWGPLVVDAKSVEMPVLFKSWKKSSDPLNGKPIKLLLLV